MAAVFDLRGLHACMETLSQVDRERLLDTAAQGMQEGLETIAEEAKTICPRDTGALAESIGVRVSRMDMQLSGEVFAAAPYAVYVEMGTQAQPARPFLYPALMANQQQMVQAIAHAVLDRI